MNRFSLCSKSFCRSLVKTTAVIVLCAIGNHLDVANSPANAGDQHARGASTRAIAAGEFAVAKSVRANTIPSQRDSVLAQVAAAQVLTGESIGAASTMRLIESPSHRQSVIDHSRDFAAPEGQAAGGGAMADFDSLMNLIETTVVPDTWEALGGNSTMAPYPQGVYVDPAGTVAVTADVSVGPMAFTEGELANLDLAVGTSTDRDNRHWRQPSKLRCVSLRRLRDEIAIHRMNGVPLSDSVLHLAGLTEVQYLVLTDDDVILAAETGGIQRSQGWFVDRESGRSTLRSDFFAKCLASSFSQTPFGCTIDPTASGLQSAMEVAAKIQAGQISIGESATALKSALGQQTIEVFGAAGDTAVGLLMVEADRHMKQLALGHAEMPEGVDNYLDVVDRFIDQGPPSGLLLRLWFTANKQSVRCDDQHRVFEISGNAIRLSGENQRALKDGRRGNITVDPRSAAFVAGFNRNWTRIRDQYPIYGTLESLYRTAAVAHLINQYGSEVHHDLAKALALEDESRDWNIVAPKQVDSIAALHTVRHAGKRHHILLASGGVAVATNASVDSKPTIYPTLAGQASIDNSRPATIQRWWWDAK